MGFIFKCIVIIFVVNSTAAFGREASIISEWSSAPLVCC